MECLRLALRLALLRYNPSGPNLNLRVIVRARVTTRFTFSVRVRFGFRVMVSVSANTIHSVRFEPGHGGV